MKTIPVKFKKLSSDAKLPFKKHGGDAGYDLFALEDTYVEAFKATPISTGVSLKMPEGSYCEIHTRSSHGINGMRVHLGVIDEGYHGEIFPIFNSPMDILIKAGEKVAQLIFKERIHVNFEETDEDFESSRGAGGFGSTGK